MLSFYVVDQAYADKLREVDEKVPKLDYETHDKFFCGVVLDVAGHSYYAPVSHETKPQRTSFLIYDREKPISSIRFSFMIPVPSSMIQKLDIDGIFKTDYKYARLLTKERLYCIEHESEIIKRSEAVYRIGCNKSHVLNKYCCDFKKLEERMKQILSE